MLNTRPRDQAAAIDPGTPIASVTPATAGMVWKPTALGNRVLVATDGSRAGGAALKLARIRRQVRAAGEPSWELHVEFGSPARAILRTAAQTAATIVVMGVGRHTTTGRLLGADTAPRVVGHAAVPVLVVKEDRSTLGRSAVAAIDFSATSARAARAALSLLEPPATLYLVHVRPRFESAPPQLEGYQHIYMSGVEAALDELCDSLPKVEGITIVSFAPPGEPSATILDFARRMNAGFIAIGRHDHGLGERLLIGSTTTTLVHDSSCPVLVTPSIPTPALIDG